MSKTSELATATLAGGCFWCTEAAFEQLRGVHAVRPGYMGGHDPRPSYEKVCTGTTGHAEVVQIDYDPREIGYDDLLTVFFTIHDPTTLNRQGHDVGSQYRSAIFWHDEAQHQTARQMIADLTARGAWGAPIVTEVTAAGTFHEAEAYHHGYFRANPYQGYCMAVVAPKAHKVQHNFQALLKTPA